MPPDIVDEGTSSDVVVREGGSVTLSCSAQGSPKPSITWRREDTRPIPLPNGTEGECEKSEIIFYDYYHRHYDNGRARRNVFLC